MAIVEDWETCSCGIVSRGSERELRAYNEQAFRYFLHLEWKHARRTGRSLLLLLVHLTPVAEERRRMLDASAVAVFSALRGCLRSVDFVGWYRSDRVVGAVLTDCVNADAHILRLVRSRVSRAISERLRACHPGVAHIHLRLLGSEPRY
jgi:hypothetical protein